MSRHLDMQPQCLITGANLVVTYGSDNPETYWVHGDLHRVGRCYIFNSVLRYSPRHPNTPEAAWYHGLFVPVAENSNIVYVGVGEYYEKRGTIVFDEMSARFNDVAREYLDLS